MDFLKFLVEDLHSVVVATVDSDGHPRTTVMDMLMEDGQTVYFLTGSFKPVYQDLLNSGWVSVTGITDGDQSIGKESLTLTGEVQHIGQELLPDLFEKNPYLKDIYPTKEGQASLEVFRFVRAQGKYYDLRQLPPKRATFDIHYKEV